MPTGAVSTRISFAQLFIISLVNNFFPFEFYAKPMADSGSSHRDASIEL